MMSNNLCKTALMASAVAARCLQTAGIPYAVAVGYMHLDGVHLSFPHVWLQTGGLVTDLTFSDPSKGVYVLGQAVGFAEGYRKPTYCEEAPFPVPQGVPVAALRAAAADLDAYLAAAPAGLQTAFAETLASATDGTKEVKFRGISADILSSLPGVVPPSEE